jgi:hypothetical protein
MAQAILAMLASAMAALCLVMLPSFGLPPLELWGTKVRNDSIIDAVRNLAAQQLHYALRHALQK